MAATKPGEMSGHVISTVVEDHMGCEHGEATHRPGGSLPLRQTRLLGLLMLVSAVLPSVSPTLEKLALMSTPSSAAIPLGADVLRSPSKFDSTDGCDAVGDVDAEARGERVFDYMRTVSSKPWASNMTRVEVRRRRDEDEEEEEEDEETKGGSDDAPDDGAEQEAPVGDGAQPQAAAPGRKRRLLPVGGGHPLMPVEKDRHSTLSSSSIGGSGSSTHLASGSNCTSLVSTPRKVLPPKVLTDPRGVGGYPHADATDDDEYGSRGRFEALPDTALLRILLFLAFPDVVSLLSANKRLNGLVRRKFHVNEHGVFRIPAFTGRPSLADRYGGHFAGNKNFHAKNKNGVAGPPMRNIRLFFGQQRRDTHPASLRHLLNFLVPDMLIPHMEAHTNAVNGRGKGCTWVFVTSQDDVKRLMQFNRLIFLDLNAEGREVYMVAPPRSRMWIQEYAENTGRWGTRPIYLPRQPMVIEVPEKPSMKRKRLKWQLQNQKNMQAPQLEGAHVQEHEGERMEREEEPHHEGAPKINGGEEEEQQQQQQATMTKTVPALGAPAAVDGNPPTPRDEESQAGETAVNEASSASSASSSRGAGGGEAAPGACESPAPRDGAWRPSRRRCHNPYSPAYIFYSHVYTTTICLGDGRYRHDPYLYNPLWEPAEPQMVAVTRE